MKTFFFWISGLLLAAGAAAQTQPFVAGLRPDQRPEQAPRVAEQAMTPDQLVRALHGVSQPIPGNLNSIASTGNWYVPLRRPGMTPPYDPRGWHTTAQPSAESKKP